MELDDDEGGWARDPGRNKIFLRGGMQEGAKGTPMVYFISLYSDYFVLYTLKKYEEYRSVAR